MKRGLIVAFVLATSLAAAPAAAAMTQTAHSGNVTATFTFNGKFPNFTGETITIAQAGQVLYDKPVVSKFCQTDCAPGSTNATRSSVHVLDLEHDGQPDVVLDLFSGGAHCCSIEEIFSFDPGTMTYVETERNFGDPGERIVDLGHNGHREFLTADDSFAFEFTDFVHKGLTLDKNLFGTSFFVLTGFHGAHVTIGVDDRSRYELVGELRRRWLAWQRAHRAPLPVAR